MTTLAGLSGAESRAQLCSLFCVALTVLGSEAPWASGTLS